MPKIRDWMRSGRSRALLFCLSVSAIVHFAGLDSPDRVIWDETGYGKQINQYCCKHGPLFDIHPPHAKLLLAASAWVFGYRGDFSFTRINERYGETPVWALRAWPAFVGTLIPIVVFLLLGELGVSTAGSLLGGLALTLENGLLIQTRTIAIDGFLVLTFLVTWLSWILSWRSPSWRGRFFGGAVAGASAAFCVGTKSTGVLAPALLGILFLNEARRKPRREELMSAAFTVGGSFIFFYLAGWYLHFQLTVLAGNEGLFFRRTGEFWQDVWNLQQTTVAENFYLKSPHASSSPWWGWPGMRSPVYYWRDFERRIYFLPNPAVWWGALAINVGLLAGAARGRSLPPWGWFCLGMFALAYFPYAFIPRSLFLYHFLPALVLLVMSAILGLERRGFFRRGLEQSVGFYAALAGIVLGFLFVSPVTFGWSWGKMDESLIVRFVHLLS